MKTLFAVYCVHAILLLFLPFGTLQQNEEFVCSEKSTCNECIQSIGCAWCIVEPKNNETKCQNVDMQHSCPLRFNPINEESPIKMLPITKKDSLDTNLDPDNTDTELVQLSPQQIALKLRKGVPSTFEVQFLQTKDLKMAVYYLIDGSVSMQQEKNKLIKLANDIVDSLRNMTANFKIGVGIFLNEKDPRSLENKAASFHNYMELTNDTTAFLEAVSDVADSISIDAPKGTLDALWQAIACKNDIDWRKAAKRVIILPTNNEYISAKITDGLPTHDGKCHEIGTYTKRMDFPTLAQINRKAIENEIDVIFAVDTLRLDSYNQLSHQVAGSSVIILSENMTNIISESILDKYLQMTHTVTLGDYSPYEIKLNYFSTCMEQRAKPLKRNRCNDLRIGDIITFEVEVTLMECPRHQRYWSQSFLIYPKGTDVSLEVEIEMLCGCASRRYSGQNSVEPSSTTCPLGHTGKYCECVGDVFERDPLGCHHNNETLIACNGRGMCICNVCDCYVRWEPTSVVSGKYCECDNDSCNRKNGLLCSGPNHGSCECGKCRCLPGFSGTACECNLSNEPCRSPDGGEICSGHGECVCGKCSCHATTEGRYSGKYCEKCPKSSTTCQQLKPCVQCKMFGSGDLSEQQCAESCKFSPTSVPSTRYTFNDDYTHCLLYDEKLCKFQFKFKVNSNGEHIVHALDWLNCPLGGYM